jgi:hypothetical protein
MMALIGLAACSGRERDITLHNLKTNSGKPEEFAITPGKPLSAPETYTTLPAPTPGGANRTDQTPLQDAVAVLGGKPDRLIARDGAPASDSALITAASRNGRDPAIRDQLASEDLEFRKRNSRFTWTLLPEDQYYRVYRKDSLDPQLWLERYRAAGAQTPAAPPVGR